MAKMDDSELLTIIEQEMAQSVGMAGSRVSEARRKAYQYYLGRAEGDLAPPEIDGRSSVVSTDVADTIEWMLPSLLKIFTAGDNVVEFEPQNANDEQSAKQATAYVNYVFYRQNPGFQILYTWFKDALLQKVGVVKSWWDEHIDVTTERYEQLNAVQLAMLMQDPSIEITSHQELLGGAEPVYSVDVKRTSKVGKVTVENVPPDEFLIDRKARNIQEARFVGHRIKRTISQLHAAGYKNVDDITSDNLSANALMERVERTSQNDDLAFMPVQEESQDETQREVWLVECYMQVDYDGDGIAEWRKITKANTTILDNEQCDGPPFDAICPMPLPHQFFGLSVADLAMPVQQQKTAVVRAILDNMYLQVNGRTFAVEGQVNIDDLLTNRPGGVVRVKNPTAVGPMQQGMPDMAGAFNVLEWLETYKENRTGFTRYSQGSDANSLNKTATGINIITNRADSRLELIARIFAETGVSNLFRRILKLVSQHEDKQQIIRLNDSWVPMDPREWKTQFDMTVNVGLGTGNKDQQAMHLNNLIQLQMSLLQTGVAKPQNLYDAASRLQECLGFKSPLFSEPPPPPPPGTPPPPPPPDPKVMLEQAKLQDSQHRGVAEMELKRQQMLLDDQFRREQLEADIALRREEMIWKYQIQPGREALTAASTYQQADAMVDDEPRIRTDAGPAGQPAAAVPAGPDHLAAPAAAGGDFQPHPAADPRMDGIPPAGFGGPGAALPPDFGLENPAG